MHVGLAGSLIAVAALVGQVRKWESQEKADQSNAAVFVAKPQNNKACAMSRLAKEREPEVLVKFKPNVSPAEIQKIAARMNDRVEDNIESTGWTAIDDLDGRTAEQVAREYNNLSEVVEYAEPNMRIELEPETADDNLAFLAGESRKADLPMPNDPRFGEQWALRNIGQNDGKEAADLNALKAWQKTTGSEDVVVAVLDTGVEYTHQDLMGNMWSRPDSLPAYVDAELGTINDEHGFNAVDNSRDPMDDNGHGTHCAGIVGAEGDNEEGVAGINWHVQIMPLKFLGRNGSGSTKDAIEAINYAIERKKDGVNIRIISASWGSTQYSRALEDAIRAAGENGILFVAAAGNSSTDNDKQPHYPSNYQLPNVISVAALDRTDNLASFSNYGAKTVHVAAPGKEILSTWLKGQYREASGTSMATPYVSGVAALALAVEPDLTVEQLRQRILNSTDKLDNLNGKVESGGRLNAAKAVGE